MARPTPPHEAREPRRPKVLEALLQDFNLIGLAGVAALALVTQSAIPLILGAAAEALYLINAPGSSWFERYVALQRARRRGQRRDAWRQRVLGGLPRAERERFHQTRRRLDATRASLDVETRALAQVELERVDDLLDQLLDLLAVRVAASNYLATVRVDALVQEAQGVRRRMKAGDHPELARVEAQRLEVLERRLGEFAVMKRNIDIVASQIATIEHSIAFLADKLVSWSAAGREPQGLKEILAGVESTEEALEQVRPVMEQIQRARQT